MKNPKNIEWYRWMYFVLLFLIIGVVGILMIGFVLVGPLLKWIVYDIPYTLPSLNYVIRMGLAVSFIAFISGTVAWFYEKHQSGR